MRRDRSTPPRDGRDAGLTLAELVIASSVGLIVLAMIGSVYGIALRTSQRVLVGADAMVEGQIALRAVERGIRNAAVDGVHISAGGAGLVVHTRAAGDPDAWECQAWLHVADASQSGRRGVLYTTAAPVGTDLASVVDPEAAGWKVAISSTAEPPSSGFAWGTPGVHYSGPNEPRTTVNIALVPQWEKDKAQVRTEIGGVALLSGVTPPQQQDQRGNGGCFP